MLPIAIVVLVFWGFFFVFFLVDLPPKSGLCCSPALPSVYFSHHAKPNSGGEKIFLFFFLPAKRRLYADREGLVDYNRPAIQYLGIDLT